jgi:hypothetical protein
MNRRKIAAACIAAAAISIPYPVVAEYSTAPGDIEAATSAASARYNYADADFHYMMAGIDLKKIDIAGSAQSKAIDGFYDTSTVYQAAADKANTRPLTPRPKTDQEKADLEFFYTQAKLYKVDLPTSQQGLLLAVVGLIRNFAADLKNAAPSQLARNIRAQQDLEAREGTLAHFLNTVTTVLHISAG